jgi:oligopeptide transport system substrate-binding protein
VERVLTKRNKGKGYEITKIQSHHTRTGGRRSVLHGHPGAGRSGAAGTALAEKQELVRNNGSEPASLDPHKVESDVEFNIISDLFEGLVSVSPTGEIQPRLAEKWENKDNTVWTFHLRPGMTWSDGTAITAQDIVWSWQRLVSPPRRHLMRAIPAICISSTARRLRRAKAPETLGVKALDDTTLRSP